MWLIEFIVLSKQARFLTTMYFWPFTIAATHHTNVNTCADDPYIYFLVFMFPTFLSYSHILHAVLEMQLWAQMLFQFAWTAGKHSWSYLYWPLHMHRALLTGGLPEEGWTWLRLFLLPPAKSNSVQLCLGCSYQEGPVFAVFAHSEQGVNQAAEGLVSGSPWRAQPWSVGLRDVSLWAVTASAGKSWSVLTETGSLRHTGACLMGLQGSRHWRLCSRSLQIMLS